MDKEKDPFQVQITPSFYKAAFNLSTSLVEVEDATKKLDQKIEKFIRILIDRNKETFD